MNTKRQLIMLIAALVGIAIIGLRVEDAVAAHHLSTAKARAVTEKVAYNWAMDDDYATSYSVGACQRRSQTTVDCGAFIYSRVTHIKCGETVRVHMDRYGYTSWSLPRPADSYCYDVREDG